MKPGRKNVRSLEEDHKPADLPQLYNSRKNYAIPHIIQILLYCFSITFIMLFSLFPMSRSASATQFHVSKPAAETVEKVWPSWNFLGCGTGWNDAVDPQERVFKYAYTTGSKACSQAIWDFHDVSQNSDCRISAYIPTIFATAKISYGIYRADDSLMTSVTVNQNASSGEVLLGQWSGIHHILISSNNGENGTYMAASYLLYDCGI